MTGDANTFTFVSAQAATSGNCTFFPQTIRLTFGTSGDEVYPWGWTYENGPGATSYIPCNGASITRLHKPS